MATTSPYQGTTLSSQFVVSVDNGSTEILKTSGDLLATTNSGANRVDVYVLSTQEKISLDINDYVQGLDLSGVIGGITSVDIKGTTIVAAHVSAVAGQPGYLVTYDGSNYPEISARIVQVGIHPDSVTLSADGKTAYIANEGEISLASDGTIIDGPGSISVVNLDTLAITTIGFDGFTDQQLGGLRIAPAALERYGSLSEAALRDIEPEYVALSPDGQTLFVTLQEANAVARIDLNAFTPGEFVVGADVMTLLPLGTKDHSVAGAGLDASDKDGAIVIAPQDAQGLYMPDSLATFEVDGTTYFITANEGDGRDPAERGEPYGDEVRVSAANLDSALADTLDLSDTGIGRLTISSIDGDTDGDGDIDVLHTFGARSYSIWTEDGELVFDSGDSLDRLFLEYFPDEALALLEGRADNKGTEPEALEVFQMNGSIFVAVGMERANAAMVFDISNPFAPTFEMFFEDSGSDMGPEEIAVGLIGQQNYAFVANEVTGTISVSAISLLG